jgi:two-component system LytT family response regulator
VSDISVLIVDDEPLARDRVRELLNGADDIEIIGEAANGEEALTMIAGEAPDLVFLDIQMPGLDGFGLLRALAPEDIPTVIFVTAFDQYAMQAFDAHAIDYLLKPFDRERFQIALGRAREVMRGRAAGTLDDRLASLLEDLKPGPKFLERILIKTGGRVLLVKTEDIDWIEAAGNYLRLHVGRDRHLLRETMAGIEQQLDPKTFVRIHRSTIVNLERITTFEPALHGDYNVTLEDGRTLTLTRTYRSAVEQVLGREL